VLLAGFTPTLLDLSRYCLREDLFSYILLIPFITGFLVARRWRDLDHRFIPAPIIVAALGIAATLFLALSFRNGGAVSGPDPGSLCFRTLSFVVCWIAAAVWTLGRRFMSGLLFPAAFLIFMTPLPPVAVETLERALQHASAEVSSWFFPLANVPFFRTGLAFQLPNITIQVAPECSGIRSTLVLFITSLLAGYLYLERPWQRAALAALVIPLGIVRNAFRIVTIGWLCTRHGPEMINSPIHHSGGPVFFAVSLVPLFVMLILFRKLGRTPERPGSSLPVLPKNESLPE
jgi:exosortase C (VPDSG-CTERM-specific)